MVMPIPCRRKDHIASVHSDATAVDCREPTVSFNDEPHGECRMAMGRGRLIRHNELQPGIQSVRCERGIWSWFISIGLLVTKSFLPTSFGVHKHEDPSLSLLFGDEITSFEQTRPDSGIIPNIGYALWIGSRRVQSGHLKPQRLRVILRSLPQHLCSLIFGRHCFGLGMSSCVVVRVVVVVVVESCNSSLHLPVNCSKKEKSLII